MSDIPFDTIDQTACHLRADSADALLTYTPYKPKLTLRYNTLHCSGLKPTSRLNFVLKLHPGFKFSFKLTFSGSDWFKTELRTLAILW